MEFLTNRRIHTKSTVSTVSKKVHSYFEVHIECKNHSIYNIITHSTCMHYNNVMRSLTSALEGQCNAGDLLPQLDHQDLQYCSHRDCTCE